MSYDISMFWPWLLFSLILGAALGWLSDRWRSGEPFFHGWRRWALLAWLVGLFFAVFHWLPGRLGLWLETALLFSFFYAIACLIGGWLRAIVEGDLPMSSTTTAPKAALKPVAAAPVAPAAAALATASAAPSGATPMAAPTAPARAVPAPVAAPSPAAPEPALMGKVEGEDRHEGVRPVGFVAPRGSASDDLKRIRGIGPQNEGRLHALGVWHFAQIAAWTHDNVLWVGSYLAFPGRIDREEWIAQAKTLAAGGETEFSKRVEHGEVPTSLGGVGEGDRNVADLSKVKRPE